MYNPLTRRSFLTGALSTLTLPLLVSAVPRRARAVAARLLASTSPTRFIVFYVPNGFHRGAFPNDGYNNVQSGSTNFALTPAMAPLAPYRSSLLFINNLVNRSAISNQSGDHARGTCALLTCTQAIQNATPAANTSFDQIIANAIGSKYPLASLQLGTDPSNLSGQCDLGYSCTYTSVVAWKDAQTPLPNITTAAALFVRMFGAGTTTNPALLGQRNSILDYATQDLQLLNRRMSADDQHKLDEYLTSLRSLEKQINFNTTCAHGNVPVDSAVYAMHVQQMLDTLVLGLKCNLTPVVTLMLGNGQSNRVYSFLSYKGNSISAGHHSLTHDGTSDDVFNQLSLIEAWEMQQLAYLISKLQATPDTLGTLYDNTLLMMTSELGHGEDHDHNNLPIILAGGANTASVFTPGRYLQAQNNPPIANLFTTLINTYTPTSNFRDSDGALTLL